MQLVLTTPGSYLHVKDDIFEVRVDDQKTHISPQKVRTILLTTSMALSTNAIKLAIENNIDIVFLQATGQPFGRFWHDRLGSTSRIRRKQLELSLHTKGTEIGKNFIVQKWENQIEFLEKLRKKKPRQSSEITSVINSLKQARTDIQSISGDIEHCRFSIMGLEGSVARKYWTLLSQTLPEQYHFGQRSRNPAKDIFNCLLNYAYGVLYAEIERACIISGIDPYIGFIHSDHYAKISMVLDIIEGYRIFAEETVWEICNNRKATNEHISEIPDGVYLNKQGKQLLLEHLNIFLDTPISHNGKQVPRRNTIQRDLHQLANSWLQE